MHYKLAFVAMRVTGNVVIDEPDCLILAESGNQEQVPRVSKLFIVFFIAPVQAFG